MPHPQRSAGVKPFATLLLRWFEVHGRAGLPWRANREPYRILVSEFMLAQTQAERVVPVFERFVARWPSFKVLSDASVADVVRAWGGLGYNSRAVRLQRLAKTIAGRHGGTLPRDESALRELPGIGPYTARAIRAFAFNADVLALDTNVRRVMHRTQYGIEWPARATAAELDASGTALLPPGQGYAFNSALMDLGAMLCTARSPKCLICPLRTVCAASPIDDAMLAKLAARHAPPRAPQERLRFEATTRFVRGRVIDRLRALPRRERISLVDLHAELAPLLAGRDLAALEAIASGLAKDGLLENERGAVRLTAGNISA